MKNTKPRIPRRFLNLILGSVLVGVGAFAVSIAAFVPAHAASFDCKSSKHPNEKLICQSTELSGLDDKMAELYSSVQTFLNNTDRQELQKSQRAWLKERLDCNDDFICTKEKYSQRIQRAST